MSQKSKTWTHPPLLPVLPWNVFLKNSKQLDPSEVVRIISHHLKDRASYPEQIITLIYDHPESEIIWSQLKIFGPMCEGYILDVLQKACQEKTPQNDKIKKYRFADISLDEVIEDFSEGDCLLN